MAGHSKWANIRFKKEKSDVKKGKLFSRITKEIISAIKQGGDNPKANTRLRLALSKAKSANMPQENIERNIKKALHHDTSNYTQVVYELYGHQGVGIIIEALTDNKNRLLSDIKTVLNKSGGNIATSGSVSFSFEQKGVISIIDRGNIIENDLFLTVTEAGAEDFIKEKNDYVVIAPPQELLSVKEAVESLGIVVEEGQIEWLPKVKITCDEESKQKNDELIEKLENIDEIDTLFHNME